MDLEFVQNQLASLWKAGYGHGVYGHVIGNNCIFERLTEGDNPWAIKLNKLDIKVQIEKPYGDWMKVALKKMNLPDGSKWLRKLELFAPTSLMSSGTGGRPQRLTTNFPNLENSDRVNHEGNGGEARGPSEGGSGGFINNHLGPGEGRPYKEGLLVIMSCLSWNFYGLGNPLTLQFLKEMISQKKPKFVFLSETLCSKERIDRVRSINFDGSFVVEGQGRGGGLAFFFGRKVMKLKWWDFRSTILMSLFEFWDESQLPWCLMGDFNNVVSQIDKRGGRPYPKWLVEGFRQVIQECDLVDLELVRGLDQVMLRYFSDIFSALVHSHWDEISDCIEPSVSAIHNQKFLKAAAEEVKTTLFDMNPDKSLGPDGMTPAFYQKSWSIVGADVVSTVQNFFATGEISSGLNDTNLVLIPKKKNPIVMGDLRPIALCNWDEDVLHDLFSEHDRKLIRAVVISSSMEFDTRYWSFEASGHYTVKSACKRLQVVNGRWTSGNNSRLWRKLWNLKIPEKVSVFLWRACRNNLPTHVNLKVKHVTALVICPFCQLSDETVEHLFVECSFARLCWQQFNTSLSIAAGVKFVDWFSNISNTLTSFSLGGVAVICCAVWKARNEVVWRSKRLVPAVVVQFALAYFDQWKSAKTQHVESDMHAGAVIYPHWEPPSLNTIKVNVDASVYAEKRFGFGWLARDYEGCVLFATAMKQ
uniref:Reverse transcriptase zinc-binding domain-containing protein n=1 Tax=Cannabis sativa TaxID=3483 RepID=A0A803Q4P0_CANSA